MFDIFDMNYKKCFCSISFLKPATNWSIIYEFNLRTMSFLCVPNFNLVLSSMPKLQSIIHFSQVNALVPGLKLLEDEQFSSAGKKIP